MVTLSLRDETDVCMTGSAHPLRKQTQVEVQHNLQHNSFQIFLVNVKYF